MRRSCLWSLAPFISAETLHRYSAYPSARGSNSHATMRNARNLELDVVSDASRESSAFNTHCIHCMPSLSTPPRPAPSCALYWRDRRGGANFEASGAVVRVEGSRPRRCLCAQAGSTQGVVRREVLSGLGRAGPGPLARKLNWRATCFLNALRDFAAWWV